MGRKNLSEKEIEIFNEIKEFLEAVHNEEYPTGDAFETLEYFYDKLKNIEDE